MSKKTKVTERRPPERRPHVGRLKLAAAALSLCAVAAGFAATRYDSVRHAVGLQPLPVSATQQSLPLSKEYVYAGGRLVATEGAGATPTPTPTPTPAGPPPTNLIATGTSASAVSLTWAAPAGSVIGYVVERRGDPNSPPTETPTGSTSPFFNDSTPAGDYAYLYRVKAVYAGGTSVYSNQDLATTIVFTDGQLQGVTIKATHLNELRRAVNAVRALVPNLGAAVWTYPDPVSSPPPQRRSIYLKDVTELRERLNDALAPLGLQSSYPSSPALAQGAEVSAQHFEQIRTRVR